MNKIIRDVGRWLARQYPEPLDASVKNLLKINPEDVKYFENSGYVDNQIESLNAYRASDVVELCTAFIVCGYSKKILRLIRGGILRLKDDLEKKPDSFWNDLNRFDKQWLWQKYKTDSRRSFELEKKLNTSVFLTNEIIKEFCDLSFYIELNKAGYKYFYHMDLNINDTDTIGNIRRMAVRCANFLKKFNNVRFETAVNEIPSCKNIHRIVMDFEGEDVIIDMKNSCSIEVKDNDFRQLFVYYLVMLQQGKKYKKGLLINARHGSYYEVNFEKVPQEIYEDIKRNW